MISKIQGSNKAVNFIVLYSTASETKMRWLISINEVTFYLSKLKRVGEF